MANAKENARGAAWPVLYLYDLLQENQRPSRWLALARTTVVRLADWLVSHQFSSLGSGSYHYTTTTLTFYGGWAREGVAGTAATVYTEDVGAALLALLRAYQLTGTTTYLLAARNAATCLRRMQCGGLRTSTYLVTGTSSGRLPVGGHAHFLTITLSGSTTVHAQTFYAGDLVAIEALNLLKTIDGDSTYGDAAAAGEFASATSATLSGAIGTLRAFWQLGADDGTGTLLVGLSSTTPREFWTVGTSASPAAPAWSYAWGVGTNYYVTSRNAALAIKALYAVDGYSAQVSDVWTWLRATADDSSLHLNTALPDAMQARQTTGTFDPTIAPAAEILVLSGGSAVNRVGAAFFAPLGGGPDAGGNIQPGPLYDFGSAGLMAPITGAQVGSLKSTKLFLSTQTRRLQSTTMHSLAFTDGLGQSLPSGEAKWMDAFFTVDNINCRGKSGLNYQAGFKERLLDGNCIYTANDVVAASMAGAVYRQQPTIYPGLG